MHIRFTVYGPAGGVVLRGPGPLEDAAEAAAREMGLPAGEAPPESEEQQPGPAPRPARAPRALTWCAAPSLTDNIRLVPRRVAGPPARGEGAATEAAAEEEDQEVEVDVVVLPGQRGGTGAGCALPCGGFDCYCCSVM